MISVQDTVELKKPERLNEVSFPPATGRFPRGFHLIGRYSLAVNAWLVVTRSKRLV